jgi:hypothetical protein
VLARRLKVLCVGFKERLEVSAAVALRGYRLALFDGAKPALAQRGPELGRFRPGFSD